VFSPATTVDAAVPSAAARANAPTPNGGGSDRADPQRAGRGHVPGKHRETEAHVDRSSGP
jgi:hypothetical protein